MAHIRVKTLAPPALVIDGGFCPPLALAGGTQNGATVLLNANGEQATFTWKVPTDRDPATDIIVDITIYLTAAAVYDFIMFIRAIADGEAGAWNILNASAQTLNFPIANRYQTWSYTIPAASVDPDDTFLVYLQHNEGKVNTYIYSCRFTYTLVC